MGAAFAYSISNTLQALMLLTIVFVAGVTLFICSICQAVLGPFAAVLQAGLDPAACSCKGWAMSLLTF